MHQKKINRDMEHSFNTDIAKEYGIEEAIIIKAFVDMIMDSMYTCSPHSLFQKEYWVTIGVSALEKMFPYIKQLRCKIDRLVAMGIIKTAPCPVFGKVGRRPNWYTFTEMGWEMLEDFHAI